LPGGEQRVNPVKEALMATIIDFAGEAKKVLQGLNLVEKQIDPRMRHIEAEGGTIDLELYTADKLSKVVFCTIRMHDTGVVEATAMAWPDDRHNLPIMWCNLTVVPGVMNVPIFDFVPMMDIVVWPEYAERYVAPVSDLKLKALEILGDTVIDKATELPSLSVYTLSPYKLVAMVTDAGIAKTAEVAREYIRAYIALAGEAGPVADADDKAYYLRKKAATRVLMKANDPGYPFMIDVFGEETTHAVFDLVF
jgi:hypothetical protein